MPISCQRGKATGIQGYGEPRCRRAARRRDHRPGPLKTKTCQGNASSNHSRTVAVAKKVEVKPTEDFQAPIDLAQKGKFTRLLADAQFYLEDLYRTRAHLPKTESL